MPSKLASKRLLEAGAAVDRVRGGVFTRGALLLVPVPCTARTRRGLRTGLRAYLARSYVARVESLAVR
jgi:hypothetical protein